MAWGGGILVTCATEIFYAEDTNGDGKADRRETLFEGFVKENPQHQVNGLRWGLDNWIHGANGDNGGVITSLKTGRKTDIHARDFRFRVDTGEFETETGMSQYGRCRDDWGNWFGGRNLQPIWHCALDDQYLRRNPFLVPPDPCVDLMDPPTCAPVFPASATLPRFNEFWTRNRFTAACGIAVYRDELFGREFSHSVFVCEPTYNLVHRSVLHRDGVTFFSRRAADEQETEFVASTDHWFRPVQARTGPDGAVWIVDMYRLVIEHPDFIPEKWHEELDFHAGRGRGRIYRVLPKGVSARPFPSLSTRSARGLVSALDHPNGPRRDMVQQMIVRSGDRSAVDSLRQLVLSSDRARVRLSALCTLEGLGAVDVELLLRGLDDPHPAVRRHAVRLAEPLINESTAIRNALQSRLEDPDAQVRMQLAYTLGEWEDRGAAEGLAHIASTDADDPLMMAAVMSSASRFPERILQRLLAEKTPTDAQVSLLGNLLRLVLDAEHDEGVARALQRIAARHGDRYQQWQYTVLGDFIEVIENRGQSFRQYYERLPAERREALAATMRLFRQAREDVVDQTRPTPLRVQATKLMGRAPKGRPGKSRRLAELLELQTPVSLQLALVDALARLEPPELPAMLLEEWTQHGPEIRTRIVDILLSRTPWTLQLLHAVEAGEVAVNELGAANRNQLILHYSAKVRSLASQLLRESTPTERQKTISRLKAMLDAPADLKRGREVFQEHCALCHELESEGTNIGPDLLAQADRDPESLLVSILDPDRAVEPRFVEYSVITMQGKILSGMLATETGNSLTLIDAQAEEHQLVRSQVDELISTGTSLMPVGFEQLFDSDQDLLDLIAYVRSVEEDPASKRPLPGSALDRDLP
ncbi:MAG: PVC-type heme-binding CxxCH protein, partial [Planctomycetota bacterium]